ncbi:MAG: BatA domain-containing protein [Acidobacteria bacterium]|nr:BatA domain-containing protein [Acidobacteriota bacterium]
MSFLNPLFLLGLAALSVPVIVHLVRRTKAPRVEFPSLMFVRRIPQRTIRRRRLQNLLLLALRSLAFMLLVLSFARPYFGSGASQKSGQRANIILLDNSLSMRYGNRFEQAKVRARTIVDEAGGQEKTALITFGQSYDVQHRFTTDTNQIKAVLSGLQPGWGATEYAQALRGASELFKEAGTKEQRIFLISDFQQTGQNPGESAFRLSKDIKLVPVDLGEQASPNLTISGAGVQPLIYQPKYTDRLTAQIANFSDAAKTGVRVEFLLNDRSMQKSEVKIAPRDATTVEFTGFNLNEGANRAVIQIEGDNFTVDNRYFITLRRAEQMKALAIDSATRGRSESFYLRNALTTGENLPFKLEIKSTASINPYELSQYRVVIINDVGGITQALASQLIKFVEGGGGLIISTGPHTDTESFNQAFEKAAPAKLEDTVQLRGDYVVMSEIKTDHPIFEVFKQSGRLSAARVFGYHRVTPRPEASVLARFEDGNPALIESSHGSGKILLFTSTFDASWNDLPLTPIYLPLVRQMARHLGEREERATHPQGQTFVVPAAKDGTPPAVDAPNGDRITDRKETSTGELIINAREPGFYRLRYPQISDYAAVNLDSKESDLSKLNPDEFVAAVTGADPKTVSALTADEKLSSEEVESRQRAWWILLIVALLLFVAEAVLARRMKMSRVIG